MVFSLLILLSTAFSVVFLPLPDASAATHQFASPKPVPAVNDGSSMVAEMREAMLRISRLESELQESMKSLDMKDQYIRESEKKIEEMASDIDRLKTALSISEDDLFRAYQRLNFLDEEVRLLWASSKKINFEIHRLESQYLDADKLLEALTSKAEKLAAIVSEQWIQIQQLEQAVQLAEMRTLKIRRQTSPVKCPFVKFIKSSFGKHLHTLKGMLDPYYANKRSSLNSFLSKTLFQLQRIYSKGKCFHHKLQGLVKEYMGRNDLTAVLANDEVVFFLASALIVFPLWSACMLLLPRFS